MIEIVPFSKEFTTHFYKLNLEWLETFFYVEDFDREVLSNPQKYIIDPGGFIFFALEDGEVLGTVALMKNSDRIFELTKMAVAPNQRGRKIGQKLLTHCIDFGRQMSFEALILYSNRKLENAIHIYRKHGFTEIAVEPNSPYVRSNIKMKLTY